MNKTLPGIIEDFHNLRILVIGEAMLDVYLWGKSDRISPEAPVPVVALTDQESAPGGAANTAMNLTALGAHVHLLSVIGDDTEGLLLLWMLKDHGISCEHLLQTTARQTLTKHRVMAGDQMLLRFDQGSTDDLSAGLEAQLIQSLEEQYRQCDVMVISDYRYGVLTPSIIEAITRLQASHKPVLVVDSKQLHRYRGIGATAVTPNYGETLKLLELHDDPPSTVNARVDLIAPHGEKLLDSIGAQIAAVTLDSDGALIFERNHSPYRTYAVGQPGSRASGAGDSYMATLALALAAGASAPHAADLAAAAAAIVVRYDGTTSCTVGELRAFIDEEDKVEMDLTALIDQVRRYRDQGRRIVFTNGCFDILHRGHITYLSQAKALGDILIVGLNSDSSVRQLKGPDRPINPLADRAAVLAGLSCVDHIIPFGSTTPDDLIRAIRPDIFVKGGDYTLETLPEAGLVGELGGQVMLLPLVKDHSTSRVIEEIASVAIRDGATIPTAGTAHANP